MGFLWRASKAPKKAKIKPNLLKSCHLLSHNGLNSNGYCSNLQKSSLFLSQNGPNAYCSNEIKRSLFLSQNGFKSSNLTKSCYLLSENGLNSNGYCSNSIKSSLFLSKDGLKYLNSIKSINLSKNSSNLIKSSNLLSQNGLNSTKSTNFLSQNGLKSSNSIKSTIFLPQNSLKTSTSTKSTNLYSQNSLNTKNYCTNSIQNAKESVDLTKYLPENIRNFSIIAHVDHGKSTLADRLLELTGTIKKGIGQPQYLDKLQVERERGITVKAQTATVFHKHIFRGANSTVTEELSSFLINLIDTPGHVDFSYEVSRSLKACQGALLVVDAAQGVQAQTVANFYLAFESNLTIIPVINKIDQPTADPDRVKVQLKSLFDLDPNDALLTSATTGQGLELVLPAVIERIPHPPGICVSPLRMLLLDSYYDEYEGVICHVAVVDGALRKGDKISSAATGQSYEVLDVGFMHPELTSTGVLLTGQVGYVVSGMWSAKEARVGDTLHHSKSVVEPLPGLYQRI